MIIIMKKPINKNGFSLIESILSLFIVTLSFSLLYCVFPLLSTVSQYDVSIEEELALSKLRETILYASDIEFSESELFFYSMEKQMTLVLEKNRIVRKDGYLIYMDGLESSRFIKKGKCIYLKYERKNIHKERFLGCE